MNGAARTRSGRVSRFVPIVGGCRATSADGCGATSRRGSPSPRSSSRRTSATPGIAGIPLQNGLYAAAAGAIIYALFCTSRQISTGPSSAAGRGRRRRGAAVTGLGGEEAAQLVAAITLVTGALFLLLAVFRMGWIAQFLSKAVVTGFLAGAAVDVVIGELPKLTGTSSEGDSAWQELASWIGSLGDIHWTTLVVGAVALAVILGLRFAAPAVPGALVLVAGGLLASAFSTSARTAWRSSATCRAACRRRSSRISIWSSRHLSEIGIASVALLLIGFSQTAGDARAFATRHRYRIDVNQESVAQGMANVGAGVFQGMPVSTSLSASSLNESAGARTPMASLTTGGLVLATLIVLAPLFSDLPKAVLAAIIIDAVVFGMIDLAELRRLHRVTRFDFWIAVAAILGVLFGRGARRGRDRRRAVARVAHLRRHAAPDARFSVARRGTQVFRDLDEHPEDETYPGIVVLRSRRRPLLRHCGGARGPHPRPRRRRRAAARARARLRGRQLHRLAGCREDSPRSWSSPIPRGSRCAWQACSRPCSRVLRADAIIDRIGVDHLHGNVHRAVHAALGDEPSPSTPRRGPEQR